MYNGIGLPTPRGSGTNGYVQKNLAFIGNMKVQQQYKTDNDVKRADALLFKEPNKEILEHERKRKIELKCFELEQEMEEQGYIQSEIEQKVNAVRKKLLDEMKTEVLLKKKMANIEPFEVPQNENGRLVPKGTHEAAAVNILKNSVFKEALGIGEEFQDGNSLDLVAQRKKEDAETQRLLEAQKDMKPIESSDDEDSGDDKERQRHHKKKKKKRKHVSPHDDDDGESNSGSDHCSKKRSRKHKKSHSSKRKHSHNKEKRHH